MGLPSIRRRSRSRAALVPLLALLTGCAQRTQPGGDPCARLFAGDLVITELMNNPAGPRESSQWFEVYNATEADIPLAGLTLWIARYDGSAQKRTTLTGGTLSARGYAVFGNVPEEEKPGWIDHSYGDRLGTLYLSQGRVGLSCGARIIDEVRHTGKGRLGASRILDGRLVPDAAGNDDESRWCASRSEYLPGHLGSPGTANDSCAEDHAVSLDLCEDPDTGTMRPLLRPFPGDLLFTELMPNAGAVSDAAGEWVEVLALRDVDLNGLELRNEGSGRSRLSAKACLRLPRGAHAVLARSADPLQNGGVESVLATFTFPLANSGARAVELRLGEILLDRASYTTSLPGVSLQLDPTRHDRRHEPESWCLTAEDQLFGSGDRGTPGAANAGCGVQVKPPSGCRDPTTGERRAPIVPNPGDLLITELLPSAGAVSDAVGEWIEVQARRDLDLNGVVVANDGTGRTVLGGDDCLFVATGSHAVLARSSDPEVNGGIEGVLATIGVALANDGPRRIELRQGEEVLDAVTYRGATKGAAWQLDPDRHEQRAEVASWCLAPADHTYGRGDRGTPGAPNPPCAQVPAKRDGCVDPLTGLRRPAVRPEPGDVLVTEILPSSSVGDATGEWVELHAVRAIDLNGVVVRNEGTGQAVLGGDVCLYLGEGSYAVLARSADPAANGGIEGVLGTFGFNLANSGDRAVELRIGDVVLDRVTYATSTRGVSWQLDPALHDERAASESWCLTPPGNTYGPGDRGTPGAPNAACREAAPTCQDEALGWAREVVHPEPGDVLFTELLPDPEATSDATGEWVEVLASRRVDLNGLALTNEGASRTTLASTRCLTVEPGRPAVLARSADAEANGGVPDVLAVFGFGLGNTGSRALELRSGDLVLARVAYSGSTPGASLQLDPGRHGGDEPQRPGSWCLTPPGTVFGRGDRGTPGAENLPCASDPQPERPTCRDRSTGATRLIESPEPGDVVITEYLANPESVDDALGEWVELFAFRDVDLNGLVLANESTGSTLSHGDCLTIERGMHRVLARNANEQANGGVAEVLATFGFSLGNTSSRRIELRRPDLERPLDIRAWTTTLSGASDQLDPASYGHLREGGPEPRWCRTPPEFTFGSAVAGRKADRGTPNASNVPCP